MDVAIWQVNPCAKFSWQGTAGTGQLNILRAFTEQQEGFGTWGAPDDLGMIHFPTEIASLKPGLSLCFAQGISYQPLTDVWGLGQSCYQSRGNCTNSWVIPLWALDLFVKGNPTVAMAQKQIHKAMQKKSHKNQPGLILQFQGWQQLLGQLREIPGQKCRAEPLGSERKSHNSGNPRQEGRETVRGKVFGRVVGQEGFANTWEGEHWVSTGTAQRGDKIQVVLSTWAQGLRWNSARTKEPGGCSHLH